MVLTPQERVWFITFQRSGLRVHAVLMDLQNIDCTQPFQTAIYTPNEQVIRMIDGSCS